MEAKNNRDEGKERQKWCKRTLTMKEKENNGSEAVKEKNNGEIMEKNND